MKRPRNLTKGLLISGGALLGLIAVLAHPLRLSASPDMTMGKSLLFSAGLLLVGLGILGRKLVALYSSVAVMLLNTMSLLVLVC